MAVAEPPEKKNKSNVGGASKMMTSMAFIVSVAVHLVIFLFVGSVVIFEGAIPPNLFTSMGGNMITEESAEEVDLPPLLEEELEPEPLETPMNELEFDTEVDLSDAMSSSDLIISNAASPVLTQSFPKPILSVGTDTGTKIVSNVRKSEQGASRGPGTPRTANIFGRTVSAANFGAILDISFSTHDTIDTAVDEIKSGFPDAILVLAPGCGMDKSAAGGVIKGKDFQRDIKDYHFQGEKLKGLKRYYSAIFLETLIKKNQDFAKLWQRAIRDDRGYVIHANLPEKANINDEGIPVVGTTRATHHGFEFLIEQGCDVIYFMADFNDYVEPKLAGNMIRDLKRNDVKVILHDFNGGPSLQSGNQSKAKAALAKETKGEIIIGANGSL
ncbi:MAG: hypothetical protein AAF571_11925 [Verrucomicrobiota bacterium]